MTRSIVVAGVGGGTGKSVVTIGLLTVLASRGRVIPFKKGPDYIDAGWLARAARHPCYNLDPYLMDAATLTACFFNRLDGEYAVIEGNRGMYDGVSARGEYSTAELALQLDLPVLLVVNCAKTTRTVAAMVLGCCHLDTRIQIAGVILNQIATPRHERVVRQSVETLTGVPVVGVMPRLPQDILPMRHLGVTPHQEYDEVEPMLARLHDICSKRFEMEAIVAAMKPTVCTAGVKTDSLPATVRPARVKVVARVRIGILRDEAFQFYYEENLKALSNGGGELVEIDALRDQCLPDELDALYIGGGFPETSAPALAANVGFRRSVKEQAQAGLPIYAECGGLIFLGQSITLDKKEYPLAGVFPVRFSMGKKPQAHGYSRCVVERQNAFYAPGTVVTGHEFRYSLVDSWDGEPHQLAMRMERGTGFADNRDGLWYNNVLALYTHVLAPALPQWSEGVLRAAALHQGLV
ncbi:MAG: cobyrinic acid a,c-diamide synthase [Desulfobulbus propionicus]|nr:MAG: cobyrinic acid a,c-diamide synthase [Desulfobulbus propionicus]